MPNLEKFNNLVKKFNDDYGINFSYEEYERHALKFKYLDNFLFEKKTSNPELNMYVSMLSRALNEHMKSFTKMRGAANYDLTNFNVVDFIDRFEEIIQERHDAYQVEAQEPKQRKLREGANLDKLSQGMLGRLEEYNKPLGTIWGENIVKEVSSRELLETLAYNSINRIDNRKADDSVDLYEDAITNIVRAKKAMEEVRKNRGFLFAIFSFRINGKEKAFLNKLNEKLEEYRAAGLPVSTIEEKENQSYLAGEAAKIDTTIAHKKLFKATEKALEKVTNSIDNPQASVDLKKEFLKAFPENKEMESTFEFFGFENLFREHKERIEKFNEAITGGKDPKEAMHEMVIDVYSKGLGFVYSHGYRDQESTKINHQTLAMAQIYTDIIMKNFSPAAYDKERFGEFANGYIMNNPNVYADYKIQDYCKDIDSDERLPSEEEHIEELRNMFTITDEVKNTYEQTKSERQKLEINIEEIEGKFNENRDLTHLQQEVLKQQFIKDISDAKDGNEIMNVVNEFNNKSNVL